MSAGACGAFIHGLEDEFMGTSMQFVCLLGMLGFLGLLVDKLVCNDLSVHTFTYTHGQCKHTHAYILNHSITTPNT